VVERDGDEECVRGDYYVLNFVKAEAGQQQFEKYYIGKMRPLVRALEDSPFEPILHPSYYGLKYLSHITHIPFEGGRELILNFNQLQQMQNVLQEQRREQDNLNGNAMGVGLGLGNMGGGGAMGWMVGGLFRFFQAIAVLTILRFFFYHSSIEVFIVIGFICIMYFTIDFFKNKNKPADNPPNAEQVESR
jgi:hypothetical protein